MFETFDNYFKKIVPYFLLVVFVWVLYIGYEYINHSKIQNEKIVDKIVNTNGQPAKESDPTIITVENRTHTIEKIAYTEKEKDPITKQPEKTDVQLSVKSQTIFVKVNGKLIEIPSKVLENSKFENGKLVIEMEQVTTLDLKTPIEKEIVLGIDLHKNPVFLAKQPVSKNTSITIGYHIYPLVGVGFKL